MKKQVKSFSLRHIVIAAVFAALIISLASFSIFAFDSSSDGWTFSQDSVANPIYIKKYFTALPRAYEAEVNLPAGTYSSASPVISNYPNNTSRDTFGFEITAGGNPAIYYYSTSYDSENSSLSVNKVHIPFNYDVRGMGWVRLALVNETAGGSSVYKLYVNGALTDTVTSSPEVQDFDAVHSQSTTREMSIGADGKNYFKGAIRSVGVYSAALTAEDALAAYNGGTNLKHASLMAYYDSTMTGNTADSIKDQTGNGHDATPAFFERKSPTSEYAYSFAFVGDTQFLVYQDAINGKAYASSIYDWIVQNKNSKNIKHVFGLGDITDTDNISEWQYSAIQHEKLGAAGIPYAIVPGNHDDYTNHTKYNNYFGGVTSFINNIDGYYAEGRLENFYMNFEVGEHKYMVIGMQYGAPDAVLEWANNVVSENSDRRVIVITHNLLGYEGQWGEAGMREQSTTTVKSLNNGIDIWNEFISLHENIIIAAAGHVDPEHIKHRTDVGVNGNTVNTFLIDPQGLDKATAYETGMVAMFYFSEDGSEVQVEYISAYKTLEAQKANVDAGDVLFHEENQFSFEVDLTAFASADNKYGTVPEEFDDAGTYPIVVFKTDKTFVGAYSDFGAAVKAAGLIGGTDSMVNGDDCVILFRSNYTLTANTEYISDYYNNVTVDLGGNTVTLETTQGFLYLRSGTALKDSSKGDTFGKITVKNGNFLFTKSDSGCSVARLAGSVGVYPFFAKDIKINSQTAPYVAVSTASGSANTIEAVFTDCVFDYTTVASGKKCYMFASGNNGNINATVIGCEIIAKDSTFALEYNATTNKVNCALTYYVTNPNDDSITYGAGNVLKLAKGSSAPTSKTGVLEFVKIATEGDYDIYDIVEVTSYGNIPANYTDKSKYPIALFKADKTFVGAYSTFGAAVKAAGLIGGMYSSVGGSDCTILFRSNYTLTANTEYISDYYNNVTVDLGGNTVTLETTQGFLYLRSGTALKDSSKGNTFGKITVKNGNFLFTKGDSGCSVARLAGSVGVYPFFAKDIKINSQTAPYVAVSTASGSANTIEAVFTDCVFDYTTVASGKKCYMFASGNDGNINATVIGCEIIAKDSTFALEYNATTNKVNCALTYYVTNPNDDSITYGAGNVLKLAKGSSAPTSKTGVLEFVKVATEGEYDIYDIVEVTSYGNIPANYTDKSKYPIVLFKADKTFVGAYSTFGAAVKAAGLIGGSGSSVGGSDAVILFRADFTHSANTEYISDFYNNVTVDLGGHTVSVGTNKGFFYLRSGSALKDSAKGADFGTITVKNGSFYFTTGSTSSSVVRLEGQVGIYTVLAEGIKISSKTAPYVGISTGGGSTNTVNATFTDCIFDYTTLDEGKSCYIFASGNTGIINATVKGGSILAGAHNNFSLTYYVTVADDSIVYEKNSAGEYVKLTLTSGTSAPTATYPTENGDAIFVKTGTSNGNDTYKMIHKSITEFKPSTSVTLHSNLIVNVYIPENAHLTKLTLDGVTYVNTELAAEDGKYHLTVELPADEAARDIPLTVTFGAEAEATYTLSILKYATKLLETSASEAEKTLVCDMLAYVKAAYAYFGSADATAVGAEIDAIIGNGASDFEKVAGTTTNMTTPEAVTFVLDAEPSVRFYFAAGTDLSSYTFKISGNAVPYTEVSKTIGESTFVCADISLFAYKMIGTIEVYKDGVMQGSFHINSYHDFALAENDNALVSVVERFYAYCKSAKAYRDEVIANGN